VKAQPVKLIYGQGYEPCTAEEATHVTIRVPGPTGLLTLPVILSGKREGTGCWTWNGSTEAPTLRPSVLTNGTYRMTDAEYDAIRSGAKIEPCPWRCHSWINDGAAQFLDDCSHELKGQTVALLDVTPPAADSAKGAKGGDL
jgi:hypothetical protein